MENPVIRFMTHMKFQLHINFFSCWIFWTWKW